MKNLQALVTKQRKKLSNLEETLEHHMRFSGVRFQEDISWGHYRVTRQIQQKCQNC